MNCGGLVVHEHGSARFRMVPNVVPSREFLRSAWSSQSTNLLYVSKLWWFALNREKVMVVWWPPSLPGVVELFLRTVQPSVQRRRYRTHAIGALCTTPIAFLTPSRCFLAGAILDCE
jgi:hypothetical protein